MLIKMPHGAVHCHVDLVTGIKSAGNGIKKMGNSVSYRRQLVIFYFHCYISLPRGSFKQLSAS